VSSRVLVAVVAGVLSAFALLLLAGHGPWSGTALVSLGSNQHGINTGDVPVLAAWAGAMFCCWRLFRR
jgi:hypothetical protein